MKTALLLTCTLLLASCQTQQKPHHSENNWHLDTLESQISFISTKNQTTSESHTMTFQQGEIINLSEVELVLDLNTVNTQIEIRDQRLKSLLFETEKYPTAHITSTLPQSLTLGETAEVELLLNLHGHKRNISARVFTQLVGEELVVTNFNPITVQAKDFNLDTGINKLTQVAKLKAISYEVPVDFKLVFNKIKSTNH